MRLAAIFLGLLFSIFLAGCSVPPLDDKLISNKPAPAFQFAAAKAAASICARHAPNWLKLETAYLDAGFEETTDTRLRSIANAQRAVIMEAPDNDVVVLIGNRRREGACIVGLRGMTPQQSYELALPWVRQFNALTNAERGQGLSKQAVQAWANFETETNIYIAAYKGWDVLGGPGAAARLLIYQP